MKIGANICGKITWDAYREVDAESHRVFKPGEDGRVESWKIMAHNQYCHRYARTVEILFPITEHIKGKVATEDN